jgi:hypothetical protein
VNKINQTKQLRVIAEFAFQINNRGGWDELLTCFEIDEATLNAALGVKHVYMRHLEPYEKVHYQVTYTKKLFMKSGYFNNAFFYLPQGEEEDREDDWYNEEEDPRARRQKAQKIQATIPLAYNHNQHNITGN